jgi:DNA-binding transcriptional MerR regulator
MRPARRQKPGAVAVDEQPVSETVPEEVLAGLTRQRDWLGTGDLAREAQTTLRAVRYYESLGLLRSSGRSPGGRRIFSPDELSRLRLITDLRGLGVPLRAIGRLLRARRDSRSGVEAAERVSGILRRQLLATRRKIRRLRLTRDEIAASLETLHGCCECETGGLKCAACDRSQREGAPRLLRLLWLEAFGRNPILGVASGCSLSAATGEAAAEGDGADSVATGEDDQGASRQAATRRTPATGRPRRRHGGGKR